MGNWKQSSLRTTPPPLPVSLSVVHTFWFTGDVHLLIRYGRALAMILIMILITKPAQSLLWFPVVNASTLHHPWRN